MIELLIVLLILAILAAMAVPMMGATDVNRLRGAARVLVADLGYAQIESITHADDLTLVIFDAAEHRYRLARVSDPDTAINNPVGNTPYEVTFGQGRAAEFVGVTIQGYSLDGNDRIQFGPYGQLDQTTAATITLGCNGRTLTITIDPIMGEASIGPVE